MGLEDRLLFKKRPAWQGERRSTRPRFTASRARSLARQSVQLKTAFLGWLAGQGNDRAHLLGRDPIRPAATTAHHANGPPPSREHRCRKAMGPAKRSPSCARSPACPPFPQSQGLHPKAIRCEPASKVHVAASKTLGQGAQAHRVLIHSIQSWLPCVPSRPSIVRSSRQRIRQQRTNRLICESELTPTCTRAGRPGVAAFGRGCGAERDGRGATR